MNSQITKTLISLLLALSSIVMPVFSVDVSADPISNLKFIRTIDTDDIFSADFFILNNPDLSGVGFPPKAHTLILLNQPKGSATFILATPPKNEKDRTRRTPLIIPDSINLAFDSVSQNARGINLYRLFLLDAELGELIAIKSGPRNVMNSAQIKYFKTEAFGLVDPQGMTIDPATGQLFVLVAGPRIVGIQPQKGRDFAHAEVTEISLGGLVGKLRGIAFNSSDHYLYVLSTEQQKLYRLTLDGELIATLDLPGLKIDVPQGMVFAPSIDPTDHPSIFHLYLVNNQGIYGQTTEWELQ